MTTCQEVPSVLSTRQRPLSFCWRLQLPVDLLIDPHSQTHAETRERQFERFVLNKGLRLGTTMNVLLSELVHKRDALIVWVFVIFCADKM